MLRSFRNNSYQLLSVCVTLCSKGKGSADGTIRLWDIRRAVSLFVMTLFEGFSLVVSLVGVDRELRS